MQIKKLSGRMLGLLAAGTVIGALAGCASFGGNIKGDFVCQAPNGICAPTSKIDDQALATMGPQPAGPLAAARARSALATSHSPSALKVVLPPRRDRFGRWREASVVYIEPDFAGLMASADTTVTTPRLSLAELAAGAPELALLQTARPAASTSEVQAQVEAMLAKRSPAVAASATAPAAPVVVLDKSTAGPAVVSAPKFPASETAGDF